MSKRPLETNTVLQKNASLIPTSNIVFLPRSWWMPLLVGQKLLVGGPRVTVIDRRSQSLTDGPQEWIACHPFPIHLAGVWIKRRFVSSSAATALNYRQLPAIWYIPSSPCFSAVVLQISNSTKMWHNDRTQKCHQKCHAYPTKILGDSNVVKQLSNLGRPQQLPASRVSCSVSRA